MTASAHHTSCSCALFSVLWPCCLCVYIQVSTQWPKELEAKQSRLAAVQATLNDGINTEVCLETVQQRAPSALGCYGSSP